MKPFIFVHINKCGGTAIKKALGYNRNEYKHQRIAYTKSQMPEDEFYGTFKFGFIRNPWDRIASMYFYRKNNLGRPKLKDMSFEQWFWKAFTTDFTAVSLMNEPCWTYLSVDGELAVDFVGKFENLKADFNKACGLLGVDVSLPKTNKTKGKTDVHYSPDMRKLVERKFNKDLEFYGRSIPV